MSMIGSGRREAICDRGFIVVQVFGAKAKTTNNACEAFRKYVYDDSLPATAEGLRRPNAEDIAQVSIVCYGTDDVYRATEYGMNEEHDLVLARYLL